MNPILCFQSRFPVSLYLGPHIQGYCWHPLLSWRQLVFGWKRTACAHEATVFCRPISQLSLLPTCRDSVLILSSGQFSSLFSNLTQHGFIYGSEGTNVPFTWVFVLSGAKVTRPVQGTVSPVTCPLPGSTRRLCL